MGAFGAALIARSHYHGQETAMLPLTEIETLEYKTQTLHCGGCSNRCMLTVTRFPGGRRYTTGNRCEKGAGNTDAHEKGADLFRLQARAAVPLSAACGRGCAAR